LDLEKRKLDPAKVKEYLGKLDEEAKAKGMGKDSAQFFSLDSSKPISAEELEAYRLRRQMFDDPMANI
jgi:hypothetical protein